MIGVAAEAAVAVAEAEIEVMGYAPGFAYPLLLSRFLEPFHGLEPVEEEVRDALKREVPEQGQGQKFVHSHTHWRLRNCPLRYHHLSH